MTQLPLDSNPEFDEFGSEPEGGSRWLVGLLLNLLLVLLGGAAIAIAFRYLDQRDTRALHNPWSYAVIIPLAMAAISKLLNLIASRLVERSLQLAFLTSLLIHLLLLTSAGNVIIFSQAWPELFDSLTDQRRRLERLQNLQTPQYASHAFHGQSIARPDYMKPAPTSAYAEPSPVLKPVRSLYADRLNGVNTAGRALLTIDDGVSDQSSNFSDDQPVEFEIRPKTVANERLRSDVLFNRDFPETESNEENYSGLQSSLGQPQASRPMLERLSQPVAASESQNYLTSEGDLTEVNPQRTAGGIPGPPARQSLPQSGPPSIENLKWNVQPQSASITRHRSDNRLSEVAESIGPVLSEADSMRNPLWDRTSGAPFGDRDQFRGSQPLSADDAYASLIDIAELTGSDGPIERAALGAISASDSEKGSPMARLPGSPPKVVIETYSDNTANEPSDQLDLTSLSKTSRQRDGNVSTTAMKRRNMTSAFGETEPLPAATETPLPDLRSASQMLSSIPIKRGSEREMAAESTILFGDASTTRNPNDLLPELELAMITSAGLTRRNLELPAAPAVTNPTAMPAFQQRLDRLREELNPSNSEDSASRPLSAIDLAINRGLEFLTRYQRNDGSWRLQDFGSDVLVRSDTAATGLSLLAYQGAGYTHLRSRYAPQINRGIGFLISNQKENGDLYIPQDPASDQNAWLYSHSIAALALCEAFGMTQDERLRPAAQRAVDFMVSSQDTRRGGWRYRPGSGADTSVTGWFMMALKSGQLAGLQIPQDIYDRIQRYMNEAQADHSTRHLYRYNPFAADTAEQRHGLRPTAVMTSVGLLSRLYLGWDPQHPEVLQGADFILAHPPMHGTHRQSSRDTYYWYYATQVIYQVGGDAWQRWQAKLYPLLIEHQEMTGEFAGSWSPEQPVPDLWARYGGRLYVTTMNLLSLEVSYRHLPLYEANRDR